MIKAGRRVFAHRFDGYWRDVGTVEAFWEANLDLVGLVPPLDLFDRDWLIHTRSEERSPAKSGPTPSSGTRSPATAASSTGRS